MSEEIKPGVKNRSFGFIASAVNMLWKFFAFSLILLAILMASARLFSSEFSRFKPEIETFLSNQLERSVTIQSLSLVWPAQGPRIQIKNLTLVRDKTQSLNSLVIANGDVAINLWKSLFYLDWITEEISFQGIQATVNPDLLQLSKNNQDAEKKANNLNQWLLRQATIEIYDSFLLLASETDSKFSYALPVLTYHGGEKQRQLKAFAVTATGSELEIRAEILGLNTNPKRIIDIYLSGQEINLEEFPASVIGSDFAQFSGEINLQLWSRWQGKQLDNIIANIELKKISNNLSDDHISISPFRFLLEAKPNNDWAFTTSDLRVEVNKKSLQPFKFNGNGFIDSKTEGKQWFFSGLNIPLEVVGNISKSYLPESIQEWLSNSNPKGKIDNLLAKIVFDESSSSSNPEFDVRFDLVKFSSDNWQDFPGLKNIDASVIVSHNHASLRLNSKQGELDLAPSFRYPLEFNQLAGKVELSFDKKQQRLLWEDFFFDSKDVQIRTSGKLEFPEQGDGYMEIVALLENGDTSATPWFLPTSLMSDKMVRYLDDSIHSGRLDRATAIIRGPFSAYPFDDEEGVFDIRAKISDVNYSFQPDWPAIKGLSAELRFFGNQMMIKADKGSISGVKIDMATAEDKDLSDPQGKMVIKARATSKDQTSMNLLANSPLKSISESLSMLEFNGELKTSIEIEIPKTNNRPVLNGTVKFNKSSILLKQPEMPFTKIVGNLLFNQNGLIKSNLRGQLWDQEFSLNLKNSSTKNEDIIEGVITSHLGTIGLSELTKINSELISSGQFEIDGKLKFSTDNKTLNSTMALDFSSDLKGLSLHFPGIINKEAQEIAPFELSLLLHNDKTRVHGNLNRQLFIVANKESDIWKGSIAMDSDPATQPLQLPKDYNWEAKLELGDFDITEWIELTTKLLDGIDFDNSFKIKNTPFHIELSSSNFSIADYKFGRTYFEIEQQKNLQVSVKSESLDALFSYPNNDEEPLVLDIKTLKLYPKEDAVDEFLNPEQIADNSIEPKNNSKTIVLKQLDKISPQYLPRMKINCHDCNYANQPLGKIVLEAIPAGDTLAFIGSWGAEEIFENKFSGIWQPTSTTISGQFLSKDFEKLSNFWGVDSGIKKSQLEASFAIAWPGSPWQFDASKLTGKITSNLTEGHIDEVSTKGVQLFSVFSLQNLKRRLTLDFNDVFEEGFFYDKIFATFLLDNGKAYSNGLKIDGTAADIEISGFVDIENNEFNQHVIVTPKLSSSLPVLAGWAISPSTALVALILDKLLFKPALDVVTRIDYKITGPLDNPEIIEVGKQQKEIQVEDEAIEKNLSSESTEN